MKVLTGLSGGVDSAAAALILQQQGHEVIGATMSIWNKNRHVNTIVKSKNTCLGPDEKEDIEAAKAIAEKLNIPYFVFDCVEDYERIVLDNFKNEYICGNTPNPCIWCNSLIKFGALPEMARKNGVVFDKFATGHYARVEEIAGKFVLKKGIYEKKDQSYFLYRLKQEQLKNIILPLGDYTKEQIRKIAKENGLPSAEKPESQDFYSGDYNELLEIEEKEGNIVNTEGKILGKHNGIWNYTTGQRKGIGISSTEPLYVIELRKETNEVVVGNIDKTFKKSLTAKDIVWTSTEPICEPKEVTIKIRSSQKPVKAVIYPSKDTVKVDFEDYQKSIAKGQSAVFYDGDIVLGGGIIANAE